MNFGYRFRASGEADPPLRRQRWATHNPDRGTARAMLTLIWNMEARVITIDPADIAASESDIEAMERELANARRLFRSMVGSFGGQLPMLAPAPPREERKH